MIVIAGISHSLPVFSLENKLVQGPEIQRYHRNEAILPYRSGGIQRA